MKTIHSIQVSIIIINYKSSDLLKQCLSSIEQYTEAINYEIIVIDNSSEFEDISFIVNKYKYVTLIKNKINNGFAAANNQGLEIAKGRYILFLNNDTIFFENTIKKVYDFASNLSKPTLIGCKLLNQDYSLQYSVFDFPTTWNLLTSNLGLYLFFPKNRIFNKYHLMECKIDTVIDVDVVTGAFIFGPYNELEKLKGFDERFFFYNEETDLCFRFKQTCGDVKYFPETSIVHLKGSTIKKYPWIKYKYEFIAYIKYYQKHFSTLQFIVAIIIHYFGIFIRIPIFLFIGIFLLKKKFIVRAFYYVKLLGVYPKNQFK